jgi:hypothetical protein
MILVTRFWRKSCFQYFKNVVLCPFLFSADPNSFVLSGIFPDINRAWMSIDSDIYLWRYEDGYA